MTTPLHSSLATTAHQIHTALGLFLLPRGRPRPRFSVTSSTPAAGSGFSLRGAPSAVAADSVESDDMSPTVLLLAGRPRPRFTTEPEEDEAADALLLPVLAARAVPGPTLCSMCGRNLPSSTIFTLQLWNGNAREEDS